MKPSIPSVVARFAAYYKSNPAWGSLHIVLDDFNVDDNHVRFCIDWAKDKGDSEGAELGEILLKMSPTQRLKMHRMAEKHAKQS